MQLKIMGRKELKILIVEDDLIIAENLKENLQELGYSDVLIASESNEAVFLYNKNKSDLCLLDIQLANSPMNGIELAELLNLGLEIPIIYMTSFSDSNTINKAKKTNPAAYLVKPCSNAQILAAIEIAINNFYRKPMLQARTNYPNIDAYIFIKVKTSQYERYEKIQLKDISHIKAEGSYTRIYIDGKATLVSSNLKEILESLNYQNIVRCHRSFAVNMEHVHSLDSEYFYLDFIGEIIQIPIGEQYKSSVNRLIYKI